MIPRIHILQIVFVVIPAIACTCCSGNASNDTGTSSDSISPATTVTCPDAASAARGIVQLEQHLSSGNARAFASDCSYPIERPYPLRSITDSTEMENYFPLLVDDSIKTVVRHAQFERWRSSGWRGWTLDNGRYLWWDGKVYAIVYVSRPEKALRKQLVNQELESLHPRLRHGRWQPFVCLLDPDNGTIYRIDEDTPGTDPDTPSPTYRMLVYPRDCPLTSFPTDSLGGTMEIEGSAGTRTLYFTNGKGTQAEIALDGDASSATDQLNMLTIISADTTRTSLQRIYWRDYLSIPR